MALRQGRVPGPACMTLDRCLTARHPVRGTCVQAATSRPIQPFSAGQRQGSEQFHVPGARFVDEHTLCNQIAVMQDLVSPILLGVIHGLVGTFERA
jgi:hypothetical protein